MSVPFLSPNAALVGLALVVLGTLGAAPARADHDSFEYIGQCYGFPGEEEMVEALRQLEKARLSPHHARRYTRRAAWEVEFALTAVTCPRARYYLRGAIDHLNRFAWRGDPCDLDDAARLIGKAILAEQAMLGYCPTPAPVIPPPAHVVPGAPAVGHAVPPRGFYLGGRRGGVYIGW